MPLKAEGRGKRSQWERKGFVRAGTPYRHEAPGVGRRAKLRSSSSTGWVTASAPRLFRQAYTILHGPVHHLRRRSPGAGRLCASCGADSFRNADRRASTPRSARSRTSSSSRSQGRFAPGELLGGRYRIVAMLGKGGMGEVYRADDLSLDQPVALKFLPEAVTHNEPALERFRSEVRIARQVSHPNVCRVYDLGEMEGLYFLSMEYVDGEDLGSLLRRIGRLPGDKALEIARKLCAGLAAAHEKGVLHRDLKPANVMLDGRGQVLLTDFGLAGLAGEIEGAEVRNGTPGLHGARATRRRRSHRQERHLRARPGALRNLHREAALRIRYAGGPDARAARERAGQPLDHRARSGPDGRARHPALPESQARDAPGLRAGRRRGASGRRSAGRRAGGGRNAVPGNGGRGGRRRRARPAGRDSAAADGADRTCRSECAALQRAGHAGAGVRTGGAGAESRGTSPPASAPPRIRSTRPTGTSGTTDCSSGSAASRAAPTGARSWRRIRKRSDSNTARIPRP